MTILISIHSALAVVAVALMLLVTIGFAPHLQFRGHDKNSLMSAFVALTSGLVWVRLLWWSILRPLLGSAGIMTPGVFTVSGQTVNAVFALWSIVAALAALGALHASLDAKDRPHYNWLTAPFFPRRGPCLWRV
jgi:hypothetical protein